MDTTQKLSRLEKPQQVKVNYKKKPVASKSVLAVDSTKLSSKGSRDDCKENSPPKKQGRKRNRKASKAEKPCNTAAEDTNAVVITQDANRKSKEWRNPKKDVLNPVGNNEQVNYKPDTSTLAASQKPEISKSKKRRYRKKRVLEALGIYSRSQLKPNKPRKRKPVSTTAAASPVTATAGSEGDSEQISPGDSSRLREKVRPGDGSGSSLVAAEYSSVSKNKTEQKPVVLLPLKQPLAKVDVDAKAKKGDQTKPIKQIAEVKSTLGEQRFSKASKQKVEGKPNKQKEAKTVDDANEIKYDAKGVQGDKQKPFNKLGTGESQESNVKIDFNKEKIDLKLSKAVENKSDDNIESCEVRYSEITSDGRSVTTGEVTLVQPKAAKGNKQKGVSKLNEYSDQNSKVKGVKGADPIERLGQLDGIELKAEVKPIKNLRQRTEQKFHKADDSVPESAKQIATKSKSEVEGCSRREKSVSKPKGHEQVVAARSVEDTTLGCTALQDKSNGISTQAKESDCLWHQHTTGDSSSNTLTQLNKQKSLRDCDTSEERVISGKSSESKPDKRVHGNLGPIGPGENSVDEIHRSVPEQTSTGKVKPKVQKEPLKTPEQFLVGKSPSHSGQRSINKVKIPERACTSVSQVQADNAAGDAIVSESHVSSGKSQELNGGIPAAGSTVLVKSVHTPECKVEIKPHKALEQNVEATAVKSPELKARPQVIATEFQRSNISAVKILGQNAEAKPVIKSPEKEAEVGLSIKSPEEKGGDKPLVKSPEKKGEDKPSVKSPEKEGEYKPSVKSPQKKGEDKPPLKSPEKRAEDKPSVKLTEKRAEVKPSVKSPEKKSGDKPSVKSPEKRAEGKLSVKSTEKRAEDKPSVKSPEKEAEVELSIKSPEKKGEDKPSVKSPEKKGEDKPSVKSPEKKGEDKPSVKSPEKRAEDKPSVKSPEKKGEGKPSVKSPEKKGEDKPSVKSPDKKGEGKPSVKSSEKKGEDKPSVKSPEKKGEDKPSVKSPEKRAEDKLSVKSPEKEAEVELLIKSPEKKGEDKPSVKSPEKKGEDKPSVKSPEKKGEDKPSVKSPEKRAENKLSVKLPEEEAKDKPSVSSSEKKADVEPSVQLQQQNVGINPSVAEQKTEVTLAGNLPEQEVQVKPSVKLAEERTEVKSSSKSPEQETEVKPLAKTSEQKTEVAFAGNLFKQKVEVKPSVKLQEEREFKPALKSPEKTEVKLAVKSSEVEIKPTAKSENVTVSLKSLEALIKPTGKSEKEKLSPKSPEELQVNTSLTSFEEKPEINHTAKSSERVDVKLTAKIQEESVTPKPLEEIEVKLVADRSPGKNIESNPTVKSPEWKTEVSLGLKVPELIAEVKPAVKSVIQSQKVKPTSLSLDLNVEVKSPTALNWKVESTFDTESEHPIDTQEQKVLKSIPSLEGKVLEEVVPNGRGCLNRVELNTSFDLPHSGITIVPLESAEHRRSTSFLGKEGPDKTAFCVANGLNGDHSLQNSIEPVVSSAASQGATSTLKSVNGTQHQKERKEVTANSVLSNISSSLHYFEKDVNINTCDRVSEQNKSQFEKLLPATNENEGDSGSCTPNVELSSGDCYLTNTAVTSPHSFHSAADCTVALRNEPGHSTPYVKPSFSRGPIYTSPNLENKVTNSLDSNQIINYKKNTAVVSALLDLKPESTSVAHVETSDLGYCLGKETSLSEGSVCEAVCDNLSSDPREVLSGSDICNNSIEVIEELQKKLQPQKEDSVLHSTSRPSNLTAVKPSLLAPSLGNCDKTALPATMEKSQEDIKAQRQAKKAAKLERKAKAHTTAAEPMRPPGFVIESGTDKVTSSIFQMGGKMGMAPENLEDANTRLLVNVGDQKVDVSVIANKSKAELRAERRAKQEAQRAAKVMQQQVVKQEVKLAATPAAVPAVDNMQEAVPKSLKVAKVTFAAKPVPEHRVKLFSHLYLQQEISVTNDILNVSTLHPAVIRLGVQYRSKVVVGSNARCLALLSVMKQVIRDYHTPPQKEFARGLEANLQLCMGFLQECRPLSVSMTNAIKYLKWQMNQLPNTISDVEACKKLQDIIDTYIREQIEVAGQAICNSVLAKISSGDVILIYGCSSLIQRILIQAHKSGTKFRVVVVDGRPWREGKEMLRRLVQCGLHCSYTLLPATSFIMREVTKVLLGAHALLANGYVMSRAGSSQVALLAHSYNVPVLVCCETHKFCERVLTDSFVYNELGHPNELAMVDTYVKESVLSKWESISNLTPLNLTYDVTPPDLVTAVVTELAILPCTSVPVILRIKPTEIGY